MHDPLTLLTLPGSPLACSLACLDGEYSVLRMPPLAFSSSMKSGPMARVMSALRTSSDSPPTSAGRAQ
jgi:hypothetical protein